MKICYVDGCEKPVGSAGLCHAHYRYHRRHGRFGQREMIPLADRLWAKTDKSPGLGPSGDCWEYRGYIHPVGYGQIGRGRAVDGVVHTHRAAYEVTHGSIPKGRLVLHSCDNRICVNPDHLRLGTYRDNAQDMMKRGRHRPTECVVRGEQVSLAKLTEEKVRAMRAEPKMTYKELGAKYGVTDATACKVILRQTWKHVT